MIYDYFIDCVRFVLGLYVILYVFYVDIIDVKCSIDVGR